MLIESQNSERHRFSLGISHLLSKVRSVSEYFYPPCDFDARRYSQVHIAFICNKANKVRKTNDVAELHVSRGVGRSLPPEAPIF